MLFSGVFKGPAVRGAYWYEHKLYFGNQATLNVAQSKETVEK